MSPPLQSRNQFGVDPAEMTSLAAAWRRGGYVLATVDVGELENAVGIGRCMSAVRAAAEPTKRASISIANRLDVLGQIVGQFQARAVADDAAAGQVLRGLADR